MIILDTNVISELMRHVPHPAVFAFVEARPQATLFTTALVQAEIISGIAIMPAGQRRQALDLDARRLFSVDFAGRVLAFDAACAVEYAAIIAARRALGRPLVALDGLIAAIARAHDATVATRNVRDFEGCGVDVVDPWTAPT